MIILLIFAFIAGIVTILSPCILPILPIVLSGSLTGGKRRPLGVIAGFILSFTFFATFSFALAKTLGFSTEILRNISVVFLLIFGFSIFIPKVQLLLEQFASRFTPKQNPSNDGFKGGVVLGMSLGLVWTPCVGPILASVLTLAATSLITLNLILITFAYSLGTAIPLFAITYGGKKILATMPILKRRSEAIQKAFGILIIITAILIFFGFDRNFQTFILNTFPSYGSGITSIEDNKSVQKQLEKLQGGGSNVEGGTFNMGDLLNKAYPDAPNRNFTGGTKWLNSDPLTLDAIEGKVVLIDFWTYTCINCIRTLPYITSWYEKYKDDGLVVIGVHTPEFEFEKNTENVLDALEQYNITYPVVQDNDYSIWKSYNNRYWPAHYLIDKEGRVRFTHFGEGKYDETETMIRELLKEAGSNPEDALSTIPDNMPLYARTPESYLGYARIDRFASVERVVHDKPAIYTIPPSLPLHFMAYGGEWTVGEEHAAATDNAALEINFEGKEVFLVMRPNNTSSIIKRVRVILDGKVVSTDVAGEDVKGGFITVDKDRLYKLIKLNDVESHDLRLEFPEGGIEVFAFTFG